jgi:hypothetical protein
MNGRVITPNQADPLHQPISRPTSFDKEIMLVGNDGFHGAIQTILAGPSENFAQSPAHSILGWLALSAPIQHTRSQPPEKGLEES